MCTKRNENNLNQRNARNVFRFKSNFTGNLIVNFVGGNKCETKMGGQ